MPGDALAGPVGDPGSCRAAAAVLSFELARLHQAALGTGAVPEIARLSGLGATLTAALTSYAADLSRAQHRYAVASRDVDRHAALALAARARRRLRLVCADVVSGSQDGSPRRSGGAVRPGGEHPATPADTVSP